jgi:hypothetical protein
MSSVWIVTVSEEPEENRRFAADEFEYALLEFLKEIANGAESAKLEWSA